MNQRIEWPVVDCGKIPAVVNVARFPGASGVDEGHVTVRPTEPGDIATQLEWISQAYWKALDFLGLKPATARLRRFFCSDLPNQVRALEACPLSNRQNCAVSWIGQAPVPPVKVALWAYHISDAAAARDHHWTTGVSETAGDTTYRQTHGVFEKYDAWLRARGMTLADNVIRTWLFVPNVDDTYAEMVAARREFFACHGLTADTHFIASTGIEGKPAELAAKITMDGYAIAGVRPEQIQYLAAPHNLCPTYRYGVTFERGTAVAYRDRKHIFISGTASIDREGQIVHPGDVTRQLDRTLENIEALLKQAAATLQDMAVFIVYIRDPGDQGLAWRRMRERFAHAPIEVVVAPVCRPGWLIEVEGQAIVPAVAPGLPAF
jgi:enamine deaminase RidA (YjgF/YER057c/UK114 family)